jgi:hypothetical protein
MESIAPAYVAWRSGTPNSVAVPAHQAGNRVLGYLKGLNTGSVLGLAEGTKRITLIGRRLFLACSLIGALYLVWRRAMRTARLSMAKTSSSSALKLLPLEGDLIYPDTCRFLKTSSFLYKLFKIDNTRP